MLAYVFWHRRSGRYAQLEYERSVIAFHSALAANRPDGFMASRVFHLQQSPWLEGDGYEDWYLIENISALESLGIGAVSGALTAPHNDAARMAASGTAGLYKPVGSGLGQPEASTAVWFPKPAGTSYVSMFSRLESEGPDVKDRLWQRMLVLGPTPEFCLLGGGPDFLPYGWTSTMVVRRPVRV